MHKLCSLVKVNIAPDCEIRRLLLQIFCIQIKTHRMSFLIWLQTFLHSDSVLEKKILISQPTTMKA